ncbi:MAG: hypothetical protein KKH28_12225 [Elusimicrobia bacterium]|nr:hypothetical protein [Elusimicrobiota bacterium]
MNFFFTAGIIASHSLRENYKNRFFAIFIVFAAVLIYASLLIGAMAVDEESRVLIDSGLALMELIALAYALMSAAGTITREIETKTIYLVFSRPVSKPAYLLGKTAGLYLTSALMLAVMGLIHLSLMALRGFALPGFYFEAVVFIWFKLLIITSVAVFISLFSTSVISTVTIAAILWTLGHFTQEAKFLIEKSSGAASWALKATAYFIPNFGLFNARDLGGRAADGPGPAFLFIYIFFWFIVPYLFSLLLFRKKEF